MCTASYLWGADGGSVGREKKIWAVKGSRSYAGAFVMTLSEATGWFALTPSLCGSGRCDITPSSSTAGDRRRALERFCR
jgi:hypothetical protein